MTMAKLHAITERTEAAPWREACWQFSAEPPRLGVRRSRFARLGSDYAGMPGRQAGAPDFVNRNQHLSSTHAWVRTCPIHAQARPATWVPLLRMMRQ